MPKFYVSTVFEFDIECERGTQLKGRVRNINELVIDACPTCMRDAREGGLWEGREEVAA